MTTSIKPFLTVSNAQDALIFYVSAFSAVETARFNLPGNRLSLVLQIDNAEFYVADEEPEFGNLSPATLTGSPVRIILQTSQADAIFAKALQSGATEICPMATEEDWRIGKLQDPFGHIWEIGYQL